MELTDITNQYRYLIGTSINAKTLAHKQVCNAQVNDVTANNQNVNSKPFTYLGK